MSLEFITFVEILQTDGYGNHYWKEENTTAGFLDGYCPNFDGYITEELFIGLSAIRDGYYSQMFRRKSPNDLSETVKYKIDMLSYLGAYKVYYLTLEEINAFDWTRQIYASFITTPTTFYDVASDFILYYVSSLSNFNVEPNKIRLIIFKKG